jgi:hypothetical protein
MRNTNCEARNGVIARRNRRNTAPQRFRFPSSVTFLYLAPRHSLITCRNHGDGSGDPCSFSVPPSLSWLRISSLYGTVLLLPLPELLTNYDGFHKYFHNYVYRDYECKASVQARSCTGRDVLKHEEVVLVVLIVTAGGPLPVSGKRRQYSSV